MNCIEIPKKIFLTIEPLLQACYGVNRHTISYDICLSVEQSAYNNDPRINDYRNKDNKVDAFAYAMATIDKIKIPISNEYNQFKFEELCNTYKIDEYSEQHDILFFMFLFSERNKLIKEYDENQQCDLEYALGVRPEMLQLYIALQKNYLRSQCKITIGNDKSVVVDKGAPWVQMALESYLKKYLGVENLKDAERELLTIYGKKTGVPLGKETARYMWGTYQLLQTITSMKSKKENSVTNEQSRFITEYLILNNMLAPDNADSNTIRGRLNYFLKSYDTLKELLDEQDYKTSPNNPDSIFGRYF